MQCCCHCSFFCIHVSKVAASSKLDFNLLLLARRVEQKAFSVTIWNSTRECYYERRTDELRMCDPTNEGTGKCYSVFEDTSNFLVTPRHIVTVYVLNKYHVRVSSGNVCLGQAHDLSLAFCCVPQRTALTG